MNLFQNRKTTMNMFSVTPISAAVSQVEKAAPVVESTRHNTIVDRNGVILFQVAQMMTSGEIINAAIDSGVKINNAVFNNWHFVNENIGPSGEYVEEYVAYGWAFYKCHFIHNEFNDMQFLSWSFSCSNIFQNKFNFCTLKKTRFSLTKYIGNELRWCNVAYAKWLDCNHAHTKYISCYVFQSVMFHTGKTGDNGGANTVDFSDSTVFALSTNLRIMNPQFVNILQQYDNDCADEYCDPNIQYPYNWVVLWHNNQRFTEWEQAMLNAE